MGRLPARRTLAPLTDLHDRQREPQGPVQRQLRAEAPADRRRRRDRPRPAAEDESAADGRPRRRAPPSSSASSASSASSPRRARSSCPPAGGAAAVDTSRPAGRRAFQADQAAPSPRSTAQPPALDDAVVALTALSNVLQTVAASPDPEEAIKEQGGLAELTGAVANQARDPARPARRLAGAASPATPAASPRRR